MKNEETINAVLGTLLVVALAIGTALLSFRAGYEAGIGDSIETVDLIIVGMDDVMDGDAGFYMNTVKRELNNKLY